MILSRTTDELKSAYLNTLFEKTYKSDIKDRYKIQREDVLDIITNVLASSIGSLTNPNNILNTFKSKGINS